MGVGSISAKSRLDWLGRLTRFYGQIGRTNRSRGDRMALASVRGLGLSELLGKAKDGLNSAETP